jgi:hypothetical protein
VQLNSGLEIIVMKKRLLIKKLKCLNGEFWHGIDENHIITADGVTGMKTYGLLPQIGDYSEPALPMSMNGTYWECLIWDGYAVLPEMR